MSKEFIPILVAAISASSALFGVLVGSVCSYFISRQQFKATVLSGNRQQWINTLRDCIADFQTKAKIAIVEVDLASHDQTSAAANLGNHDEAMKTMRLLVNKISLLINPKERDHSELFSSLNELEAHCIDGDPADREKERILQVQLQLLAKKFLNVNGNESRKVNKPFNKPIAIAKSGYSVVKFN